MKRLIFPILIFMVGACSEDEDPKFCFECVEFTVITSPSGFYDEETVTTEYCDKTDGQAEAIERDGTNEHNEGANTIIKTTTCTKKE